jgi:predicted CoA-substrate-specific enzyme activase
MRSAGIDIGSRTIKIVIVEDNKIVYSIKTNSTYNPLSVCSELLKNLKYDTLTATGYGRHLIAENYSCNVISEITAFAVGSRFIFPECNGIIDIGGQDTKAIKLDEKGNILKFEMNDKCAAGTGRFLEVMAGALGSNIDNFSAIALSAKKPYEINNMCTVFAESEIISLISQNCNRNELALGIHLAVTRRATNLMKRVDIQKNVVFAGGVAYNTCMIKLLEKQMKIRLDVYNEPQIIGAIGCAVYRK